MEILYLSLLFRHRVQVPKNVELSAISLLLIRDNFTDTNVFITQEYNTLCLLQWSCYWNSNWVAE